MPKPLAPIDSKSQHNFYLNQLLKCEFYQKLQELGLQKQGSAAIRALMRMLIEDKIDIEQFKPLVNDEIIITPKGKISKL